MHNPNFLDWINTLSAAIGAIAIVAGVFGANSTIKANRRSARQLRRSEVAENLIAISHNIEDAFRHIRTQVESMPVEKEKDKGYFYQRRYDRIIGYTPLFKELRDAQIRVHTVLGVEEVDEAVDSLFKARNDIVSAIEFLGKYYSDDADRNLTHEERELNKTLRQNMSGTFSKDDELGTSILSAIKEIEKRLSPIARLNR